MENLNYSAITYNMFKTSSNIINYDVCNMYLLDTQDLMETTQKAYKTYLKGFFEWLNTNDIKQPTEDTIKLYKLYLKNNCCYTIATKNQYIRAVKHFFKWANNRGLYNNVSANINEFRDTRKHKRDSISIDALNKILNDIGTSNIIDLRDRAIIIMASALGLRANEIVNININDIEQKDNIFILNILAKGYQEKSNKKAVPIGVINAINDYLAVRGKYKTNDALFISTSNRALNKRLTKETLSQIIKNRFINSGFNSSKLTLHSLRHLTADASLKASNNNIYKTQKYLRHKNATTTEIYLTEQEDIDINFANDVFNTIFNKSSINDNKTELKTLIRDLNEAEIKDVINYIKNIKGGLNNE